MGLRILLRQTQVDNSRLQPRGIRKQLELLVSTSNTQSNWHPDKLTFICMSHKTFLIFIKLLNWYNRQTVTCTKST